MNNVRELFPQKQKTILRDQLVTLSDLEDFKTSLLASIKDILKENKKNSGQWLKSYQVKQLLSISPGTLQTLRNNGTLPFTKIGHIIYYNMDDINKVLEDRKRNIKQELSVFSQKKYNRDY